MQESLGLNLPEQVLKIGRDIWGHEVIGSYGSNL